MTDRWSDISALRRDHDTALRLIDRQGMIRCVDPRWLSEAKRLFSEIIVALRETVMESYLSLVYCYDQQEQPPNIAKCDGYSSVSEQMQDGHWVASIGVSIQALQRGDAYAMMILLHEMAHILRSYPVEHGVEFHAQLDKLIAQFNRHTGSRLVNDRFGLQMRHDSRSYDPFEAAGNPPPVRVGSREFRTEQQGRII